MKEEIKVVMLRVTMLLWLTFLGSYVFIQINMTAMLLAMMWMAVAYG